MVIRKPNGLEIKEIILLSPKAIFDGTLGEAKPSSGQVEKLIEALLENGSYYLIAAENNELMGWILIGPNKDQFTGRIHGFIYELYVLENHRGKGISKELMREGIHHLKQAGYSEVRLSAFQGNPAIQLYKQFGFQTRTVSMSMPL